MKKLIFLILLLPVVCWAGPPGAPPGSGSVDTTGTVNANEIAVFNDSNTLKALTEAEFKSAYNAEAGTDFQAYDADLTTYAGITPSANVQTFLGAATYAAMRTQLGIDTAANFETTLSLGAYFSDIAAFTSAGDIVSAIDGEDWTPTGTWDFTGATAVSFGALGLGANADFGDYDVTSIDKLEGYDTAVYIDMGADGILELEADTGVYFGSTGVSFLDNNGSITLLGLGDGTDENFKIDLNSANVINFSSTTGVTGIDINDMDLLSVDKLEGYDSAVYIDMGADGIIEIEADTGVQFGSAGVQFLDDADGAITLKGLGDGSDEDLTINLDDTADTITFSSSTGVATWALTGVTTLSLAAADDPLVAFAAATASESDWWAGVNNDSEGDDDDPFEIRQSATPGTSVQFYVDTSGNTYATGTSFSAGQTRKIKFLPKTVELDGTAPPALADIGTDGQTNISALQFDADGGATGDDIAFISWLVPDGYVVDSARLNVAYTFSTAEDAADEAQFDFTVNAVAPGEALDAAGTALADQTTVIADASTGNGLLYVSQYNIEVEDIAVDDLVTILIAVDESASALANSGTLDVLYFEIEYESTE